MNQKNKNGKAIVIDWNCRDDYFLTLSDGTKVKCPRFLREKEVQLARHQRKLSKKFKKDVEVQSNNYYKEKYIVAKIHEKVAWQRADLLHKLSTWSCISRPMIWYVVLYDNLQGNFSKSFC